MKKKDFSKLINKRFGKIVILSLPVGRGYRCKCKCDCGNIKDISLYSILKGVSKSCGCLKSDFTSKRNTIHGLSNTKLYNVYTKIIGRCNNPKQKDFKWYGGKGITICDEWKNDFIAFYNWSIENGYKEETNGKSNINILSIDRIDNNKGYSPENCRWVNMKTQARNSSRCHYLTYKNLTKCISEWAEFLDVNERTLRDRLKINDFNISLVINKFYKDKIK